MDEFFFADENLFAEVFEVQNANNGSKEEVKLNEEQQIEQQNQYQRVPFGFDLDGQAQNPNN